ncbi:MAG: hypothetical protein KAR64_03370 [Thermoplasmatales archaeon]|nr:hypothetical protein [Thermoplasmatales archaeon]
MTVKTKITQYNNFLLSIYYLTLIFKWVYTLAEENLPTVELSSWKIWTIKRVIRYMDKRLHPYVKLMEEGINPMTHDLT